MDNSVHTNWISEQQKNESSIIAIDFDGVLHKNSKGYYDGTIYDEPVKGAFNALKYLSSNYTLVIYSFKGTPDRPLVNGKDGIELIWDWLKVNKVDQYITDVVRYKPNAMIYIDDKGYRFNNWEETLKFLKKFE